MAKYMDTQLQNFWKESISKEAALRYSWHQRYAEKFKKNRVVTSAKSAPGSPRAVAAKARHSSVPNGKTVAERIRRLESEQQQKKGTNTGKTIKHPKNTAAKTTLPLKDMRPATAGTRQLLYNGISAHGDGRYAYLRKRKMLTPEEKFEFPILSSCQYGWKIRDFGGQPKPSPHARVCVIKDSFYRNSGIILG